VNAVEKLAVFACTSIALVAGGMQEASAVDFSFTFTTPDQQTIGGIPNLPIIGAVDLHFDLTNQTGQSWTDFHISSSLGPFDINTYVGPGELSAPSPITLLGRELDSPVDILELNVPVGETLSFDIELFCAGEVCSFGTFIRGFPTFDSVSVPAPTSLALMCIALVGLGWSRYRKGALRVERPLQVFSGC